MCLENCGGGVVNEVVIEEKNIDGRRVKKSKVVMG